MRIGSVKYLNALPLTYFLKEKILFESPARLAELLEKQELDIALAPIVTLFDHPEWQLMDGIGIGTRSEVQSVRVVFRNKLLNLKNVSTIDLGVESRSSILLLKVLLRFKYGRDLSKINFSPINSEARLLIGDEALKIVYFGKEGPSVDLGLEWTEWTGLPFVFAGWVSRHREISAEWVQRFKTARDQGLENISLLLKEEMEFPKPFLKKYLLEKVSYDLGPKEKEGIALFNRYATQITQIN